MRSYQLGMYEKAMPVNLTWKEKLQAVKEVGFDYLEMSIDETEEKLSRLNMSRDEKIELINLMLETDVKINSICLSGHRKFPLGSKNLNTQKKSLEIMEKAIELASFLGIRIIQLAGYDVFYEESDEETREIFIKNLGTSLEYAAKYGINLGFETMEATLNPFIDTVEKAMFFVNEIKSPYLGVYPDIGNLKNSSITYNKTVNNDIMTGSGHIFAAHLKETVTGKYREIPYGTGHTEYIENITLLKALGVRMFVGEFWHTGEENWKEICKNASEFLRDKLDRCFDDV